MTRKTHALIDLNAIASNFEKVSRLAPESQHVAVVKANSYGNGAIQVAKKLSSRADMLAVAFFEEALALRKANVSLPILILQGPHSAEDLEYTRTHNLHWMLHQEEQLQWFISADSEYCLQGHQWIKFDTGMHRLGFPIEKFETLEQDYPQVFNTSAVIATHLARADEVDQGPASEQIHRFLSHVDKQKYATSIANSAGTIAFPMARANFNRLGISLYGSSPFDASVPYDLAPVMHLYAPIISIREVPAGDTVGYAGSWQAKQNSKIATVSIGYADGYPRHFPSGTKASLNGQDIYLAGRVSMDMLTFDVTHVENVNLGDMVELWGANVCINELAASINTIGYELMTRVSNRVPRLYLGENND
ncbi:alanine racemase [Glaciecola sp. 1036]|uniref:alanine racemase n=1 Tax=Alteromonadaceae TaxID=72275 RepID=UPI003D0378AF